MKIRLIKGIFTSNDMNRLCSEYKNVRIMGTIDGYLEVHMETIDDYISPEDLMYLMLNFKSVAFVGDRFIMEQLEEMETEEELEETETEEELEEDCIELEEMEDIEEELFIEEEY